ncbi:hypothetical protein SCHPADRAFT_943720 [Schizopora paradoxa]|uniref:TM7S3/TM198-like domain-containing protein n=1 Tax=Schizopora paradoxa TaxID=27342 RepID=A0A0H2RBX1_9AGAM|nr:hypothetical protein SCHPADRAFT_943720 [Schizopora paradoxa]
MGSVVVSLRWWRHLLWCAFAVFAVLAIVARPVAAQNSSSATSSGSSTSLSTTVITTNITTTQTSTTAGRTLTNTAVVLTTFTSTLTPTSTTTANATATSNSTSSATPTPITLDTRISPGFGVLGAILIITGLPSAFWGHKNRWSSFFLIGFYTFALSCLALILKFGVLEAVNPPSDKLVGVFVLACCIAGVVGGGVAIFFWQQAKYFIGAWGGFAVGLWVQCLRDGGLIRPIGMRWILYIGLGVVGFCLCTLPKIHYHVLLVSTAAVGATAFVLGIDCFTTANLKEFYIWNIGFQALFTKYTSAGIQFPLSQMMEIELGLIGAFFLMGCAVQLRVLRILQFKLREITREAKRREDELEAQATGRFKETEAELALWEKEHGRMDSRISSFPLMKDQETNSPGTEETSQFSLHGERRQRYTSGVSDFMAAPPPEDRRQSLGALPAMDLGFDIESNIPQDFVDKDLLTKKESLDNKGTSSTGRTLTSHNVNDLKKKEDLMAEIASIRKSIEVLRTETPGGSSAGSEPSRSRHQSFISRRTMSIGFAEALDGPSRPPRSQNPRERATSMDRLSRTPSQLFMGMAGDSISRPSSAPPQEDKEEEWNNYVRERKLFQPPAGASAPINRSSGLFQPTAQRAVPPSVAEALARRHHQEVALESGELSPLAADLSNDRSRHMRSLSYSSDEMLRDERRRRDSAQLNKSNSPTGNSRPPITILPPRRPDAAAEKKEPAARTYTYEELAERHREKMRNLQEPLSRAEQERAKLEDARNRWARSQDVERREMAKREERRSRQLAEREKRNSASPDEGGKRGSKRASQLLGGAKVDDEPGLNADRLGKLPSQGTSKRQSVLKVEDWRRYQQDVESGLANTSAQQQQASSKRHSNVPFPAPAAIAPRQERRRSSQLFPGTTGK